MEGNQEQVGHEAETGSLESDHMDSIQYTSRKDGSVHFFGSPKDLADFIEQENSRDNN